MSGGIDKRLTSADFESFPDALKQRIALARCFIKEAPIFLLDNPAASLDTSSELHLIKKLSALKGRATVAFTTFRPSHMRLADRVIVIEGRASRFGWFTCESVGAIVRCSLIEWRDAGKHSFLIDKSYTALAGFGS